MTEQSDDAVKFSRSGETHFLGKCDEEQAVPMPSVMKADLAAVAHLMDPPRSPAELARTVLSDFLYGRKAQVTRIIGR